MFRLESGLRATSLKQYTALQTSGYGISFQWLTPPAIGLVIVCISSQYFVKQLRGDKDLVFFQSGGTVIHITYLSLCIKPYVDCNKYLTFGSEGDGLDVLFLELWLCFCSLLHVILLLAVSELSTVSFIYREPSLIEKYSPHETRYLLTQRIVRQCERTEIKDGVWSVGSEGLQYGTCEDVDLDLVSIVVLVVPTVNLRLCPQVCPILLISLQRCKLKGGDVGHAG